MMNLPSEAEILGWLINYVAKLTNVKQESIRTRASFQRLGLDSVMAVGMTADLESWLGRKMPPSLPYDYPNIDSLTKFLVASIAMEEIRTGSDH